MILDLLRTESAWHAIVTVRGGTLSARGATADAALHAVWHLLSVGADPVPYPAARCACGRRYAGSEAAELQRVGVQDDFAGGILGLLNCVCGSTIAIALVEGDSC